MFSSTTALLWKGHTNLSKPSLPSSPSSKPSTPTKESQPDVLSRKPARNTSNSVLSRDKPQDFAVANTERTVIKFGAFRSHSDDDAKTVRGRTMLTATDLSNKPFNEALDSWLETKQLHVRESTIDCYRDYLVPVRKFFGPEVETLKDIHIGLIEEYQKVHKKTYHPASVNHHINTLSQIMCKAGLWAPISEHYQPLPLPEEDPPKVLSEEEEDAFFKFASLNEEWKLAYHVASLTNNSTASGKELRMLQLQAIYLENDPPYFHVPKNMKTKHRQRNIPLNERGEKMIRLCLKVAAQRGSTQPVHYLFPFREKRNFFNPNKPSSPSWLRYRWKLLVDAAMKACLHCLESKDKCLCGRFMPILPFRLKPHNMRHQCMTRMIESGTPIETVREIAGHGVDSLVTRGYIHGRMKVMARAMDAINPKKPQPVFAQGKGKGVTA